MKLAMISQPMNGKSTMEILDTRDRAVKWLKENGYTVEDTLFAGVHGEEEMAKMGIKNSSVYHLGVAIEAMSKCDAVYFCRGWDKAKGCQAEHFIAKSYELQVIYES